MITIVSPARNPYRFVLMRAGSRSIWLERSSVLSTSYFYVNQRALAGRINVFRNSGNSGAGDHYSRNLISAPNPESQPRDPSGQSQAGVLIKRPNAGGTGGIHTLASFDRGLHAALEPGFHYISVCRSQPGAAALDTLLGHNRL